MAALTDKLGRELLLGTAAWLITPGAATPTPAPMPPGLFTA